MKKDYKPCKRKKCPYYDYKVCPHKNDCDHSKESVWRKMKGVE